LSNNFATHAHSAIVRKLSVQCMPLNSAVKLYKLLSYADYIKTLG